MTVFTVLLCLNSTGLFAQNWNQIIKAAASDRAADDIFGWSVAISGDYAIVGAPYEDENATGGSTLSGAGSAYIFKRTGTTWAQEAKIVASDRAADDNFGFSVAISGDYVVVGTPYEDENATGGSTLVNAGSAYIFKRTGTTWAQEAKIVASDRAVSDNFGYSVAINGDYVVVGAYQEDENAAGGSTLSAAGSAYIFKRTGTTWAQEAKIVASDRAVSDRFGYSVAIGGDYVVVGAYSEDEDAAGGSTLSNAGSVYIFKRTGTTWAQEAKIVASDRAVSDLFGYSVAISGDYVVVGAYWEDEDAAGGSMLPDAGSAYFFKSSTVLPVELLDFAGTPSPKGNLLTWATASEVNNKGYDIERLNGNGAWSTLGFVKGNNKASNYNFVDANPYDGINYYRLKQVDFDGTETLSKVVSITTTGKGTSKIKIFPTNTEGVITIDNDGLTIDNINVYNNVGQLVLTTKVVNRLDLSALPSGMYFVQVKVGSEVATEKVFKQ